MTNSATASATGPVRILGLDPGLRRTGWGIVSAEGNRLSYIAAGAITPPTDGSLASRLSALFDALLKLINDYTVDEAAVEETFVNKNPAATLKLGQARGVVLLAPANAGLSVAEYAPNLVKKSVVGAGHADKTQIQHMVKTLLPGVDFGPASTASDVADALAVAICHAHHRGATARAAQAIAGAV
ncbi:MAG: crossover junction endodeoxyribonuclease RuvC [Alphaproteobacteria bacterium]|nr:crossover junction endodeoxyribonuclease RuvC [Alphaproteobacteria bacterium SS10]